MFTFGMLAMAIGNLFTVRSPQSLLDGSGGLRRVRSTQEEQRKGLWSLVIDVSPPLSLQQRWLTFRDAAKESTKSRRYRI